MNLLEYILNWYSEIDTAPGRTHKEETPLFLSVINLAKKINNSDNIEDEVSYAKQQIEQSSREQLLEEISCDSVTHISLTMLLLLILHRCKNKNELNNLIATAIEKSPPEALDSAAYLESSNSQTPLHLIMLMLAKNTTCDTLINISSKAIENSLPNQWLSCDINGETPLYTLTIALGLNPHNHKLLELTKKAVTKADPLALEIIITEGIMTGDSAFRNIMCNFIKHCDNDSWCTLAKLASEKTTLNSWYQPLESSYLLLIHLNAIKDMNKSILPASVSEAIKSITPMSCLLHGLSDNPNNETIALVIEKSLINASCSSWYNYDFSDTSNLELLITTLNMHPNNLNIQKLVLIASETLPKEAWNKKAMPGKLPSFLLLTHTLILKPNESMIIKALINVTDSINKETWEELSSTPTFNGETPLRSFIHNISDNLNEQRLISFIPEIMLKVSTSAWQQEMTGNGVAIDSPMRQLLNVFRSLPNNSIIISALKDITKNSSPSIWLDKFNIYNGNYSLLELLMTLFYNNPISKGHAEIVALVSKKIPTTIWGELIFDVTDDTKEPKTKSEANKAIEKLVQILELSLKNKANNSSAIISIITYIAHNAPSNIFEPSLFSQDKSEALYRLVQLSIIHSDNAQLFNLINFVINQASVKTLNNKAHSPFGIIKNALLADPSNIKLQKIADNISSKIAAKKTAPVSDNKKNKHETPNTSSTAHHVKNPVNTLDENRLTTSACKNSSSDKQEELPITEDRTSTVEVLDTEDKTSTVEILDMELILADALQNIDEPEQILAAKMAFSAPYNFPSPNKYIHLFYNAIASQPDNHDLVAITRLIQREMGLLCWDSVTKKTKKGIPLVNLFITAIKYPENLALSELILQTIDNVSNKFWESHYFDASLKGHTPIMLLTQCVTNNPNNTNLINTVKRLLPITSPQSWLAKTSTNNDTLSPLIYLTSAIYSCEILQQQDFVEIVMQILNANFAINEDLADVFSKDSPLKFLTTKFAQSPNESSLQDNLKMLCNVIPQEQWSIRNNSAAGCQTNLSIITSAITRESVDEKTYHAILELIENISEKVASDLWHYEDITESKVNKSPFLTLFYELGRKPYNKLLQRIISKMAPSAPTFTWGRPTELGVYWTPITILMYVFQLKANKDNAASICQILASAVNNAEDLAWQKWQSNIKSTKGGLINYLNTIRVKFSNAPEVNEICDKIHQRLIGKKQITSQYNKYNFYPKEQTSQPSPAERDILVQLSKVW